MKILCLSSRYRFPPIGDDKLRFFNYKLHYWTNGRNAITDIILSVTSNGTIVKRKKIKKIRCYLLPSHSYD